MQNNQCVTNFNFRPFLYTDMNISYAMVPVYNSRVTVHNGASAESQPGHGAAQPWPGGSQSEAQST